MQRLLVYFIRSEIKATVTNFTLYLSFHKNKKPFKVFINCLLSRLIKTQGTMPATIQIQHMVYSETNKIYIVIITF